MKSCLPSYKVQVISINASQVDQREQRTDLRLSTLKYRQKRQKNRIRFKLNIKQHINLKPFSLDGGLAQHDLIHQEV